MTQSLPYNPTIRDLCRVSFRNASAKEVKYTGPILKGLLGSFGVHAFIGANLMFIHPVLGLLSLAPLLGGIKAARDSGQAFRDQYAASIENPDIWTEYVDPKVLEGSAALLDTPITTVIEQGLAHRISLGKFLPPNLRGAINPNHLSPPSSKTASTVLLTEPGTGVMPTEPIPNDGTAGTGSLSPSELAKAVPGQLVVDVATHLMVLAPTKAGKTTITEQLVGDGSDHPVYAVTLKAQDHMPVGWSGFRLSTQPEELAEQLQAFIEMMGAELQRCLDGEEQAAHTLVVTEALAIADVVRSMDNKLAKQWGSLLTRYVATGGQAGARLCLQGQDQHAGAIFDRAATAQNLKVVLCGSEISPEKFAHVTVWAQHFWARQVDASQIESLKMFSAGFHHFWCEQGQLYYGATPKSGSLRQPPTLISDFADVPQRVKTSQPVPEATLWQIPQLIEELQSRNKIPCRPVDLGKSAWAKRIGRAGLIAQDFSGEAMAVVIEKLCSIYDFYQDADGQLCLKGALDA